MRAILSDSLVRREHSSCHNVRIAHVRENLEREMLSLRANCRFQVRAVVDLSLPALGE